MAKVEINELGLQNLLNVLCKNIEEERDLALERYRRQDEQVDSNEQFVLQGKHMVDFLKTASDRTDALMGVVKLIFSAVHKDGVDSGASSMNEDEIKKMILKNIEESENSINQNLPTDFDSESNESK